MDKQLIYRLERDVRHLRAAVEAEDIALALVAVKRVRRTSTLVTKDIANTRDTLHVQEDDKP